jgi:hypothetical protein
LLQEKREILVQGSDADLWHPRRMRWAILAAGVVTHCRCRMYRLDAGSRTTDIPSSTWSSSCLQTPAFG